MTDKVIFVLVIVLPVAFSIVAAYAIHKARISNLKRKVDGFDKVLSLVKDLTYLNLGYLTSTDLHSIDKGISIMKFEVGAKHQDRYVKYLKKNLCKTDYLTFYTKLNDKTLICVIKATDQFEILRALNANGCNYDIDTEHIIKHLQEWHESNGVSIWGAGDNWIDIRFDSVEHNIELLADKINKLCPDVVAQGNGSLTDLQEELNRRRRVVLWWD